MRGENTNNRDYKDTIFVTNRKLVKGDFLERIKYLSVFSPRAILLREKDLSEEQYKDLATEVLKICKENNIPLIIHNFSKVAKELGVRKIHYSFSKLEKEKIDKSFFEEIGTSCHSIEEANKAVECGADYIFAGHIFQTDCKKDLKPRGILFLQQMVQKTNIPVWAIGGIDDDDTRKRMCLNAGAKGVCVMSYAMNKEL